MAILKNNEYKTVVWGSKNNFITGLDPLGLQITSEATYATLLPGVTIGEGSIIGAGTVVTKDIPKNSLALERSELKILRNKRSK